jgi:hypothetical protein
MTTHPISSWSESLQQQTREAIEQIQVTPGGNLHFKHATQGYAYATVDDYALTAWYYAPKQAVMSTGLMMLRTC